MRYCSMKGLAFSWDGALIRELRSDLCWDPMTDEAMREVEKGVRFEPIEVSDSWLEAARKAHKRLTALPDFMYVDVI